MDFKNLTDEQLAAALTQLQGSSVAGAEAASQLQESLHDLQVYRMELEMQNRELRETQAELEQAIRRQNDLYDFSPTGYLTLSQAGLILDANLTATELLNTERPRLRGMRFGHFLDPIDNERLVVHLDQTLTGKTSVVSVTLHGLAPRLPLPVQLSSRLAPPEDHPLPQVLTSLTDISDLRETQQRLEELNREQETFSYSISHDLRTPLVTITNFSSLLIAELPLDLEEPRECLKRIQLAAERMDQMLTDLLEYNRTSRSLVQSAVVDVEQVIDDVLSQLDGVIQPVNAQIAVRRPLPRVRGSKEALRQVLSNLLTNALKFVAPGRAPEVEVSATETIASVVLVVQDHGIGIPPEHRERVFGIFERLHRQSQYPGTGVGLAIVRRAVDRMGGRISLESTVGSGCRFSVELPRA